jgi:hypothetical protein
VEGVFWLGFFKEEGGSGGPALMLGGVEGDGA